MNQSIYVGVTPGGIYRMRPDELYHHGILGMKWGVRRYQNPDGSYTAAGKARYGVEGDGRGRGGAGVEMSRKQQRAQATYERIRAIRKDEARMNRMSGNQRKSLDKAERYWKERSQGKTPTERRGIIKRQADWYRSHDAKHRAGITAAANLLTGIGGQAVGAAISRANGVRAPINVGAAAVAAMRDTAWNLAISELLYSKAAGHF